MLDTPATSPLPLADLLSKLDADVERLRPIVDAYITGERMARYLKAIADTPAPSTAASAMRAPVLRELLEADKALGSRLALELPLPSGPLRVVARVLTSREPSPWHRETLPTGMGVRFLDVGPTPREALERFIDARARSFQL